MPLTSELIWQDQQHQILFELIDEIKADHVSEATFVRLHEYAEHHFCLEEAYMKALDYPDYDNHLLAHNKFRHELKKLLDEYHNYDAKLRDALSDFLTEWLKRHIFGVDKKLEKFILDSDQR